MEASAPVRTGDPLGEALHAMRMSGAFYCRSELSAPWGLGLPPMPGYLWFHVVTSGHCQIDTDWAEPHELGPGDVVLVPHGQGHRLRSDPDAAAAPILDLDRELVTDRYEILRHGGGGAVSNLICAAVRLDDPGAFHMIRLLPPTIHVDASRSLRPDWMHSTLGLMAAEARELRPGGETVITRLADILVIQAIRSWIETEPAAQTGWLGALRDHQIGYAIGLIHREPARAWTLALLAKEAAMSRSAFAARFSELVGEPAMHYVARWRMQLAVAALKDGDATVRELADRLGYQSEAAFSRAFKRVVGMPPGGLRRTSGEAWTMGA
ncbi:MAG: AraC family transcriptional regulator [Acidimicrobiales bacterium]